MKNQLGLTFIASGTLVLVALSACAANDDDPTPSAPTSTSPTRSATPTTGDPTSEPTSTPNDAASASAVAAVTDYFAVLDDVRTDGASDLADLATVATGAQLAAVEALVRRQREQGQRQTGATAISESKVQSVTLDNSDPDAGKVPTVVVDVCWDVTAVDVLDRQGKSIVSPDRPDTGWTRYTVANYDYASDPTGGWRVATGHDLEKAPCAAA